jgi:hypothetical protein
MFPRRHHGNIFDCFLILVFLFLKVVVVVQPLSVVTIAGMRGCGCDPSLSVGIVLTVATSSVFAISS